MLLVNAKDSPMKKQIEDLQKLLFLLFKSYKVEFQEDKIILNKGQYMYIIDESVFNEVKFIANKMFPFKNGEKNELSFNPQNQRAKEIAEKIKKGREKIAKQKQSKGENESVFERYISILSVGLQIPLKEFYRYTVFQLLNTFDRYEKKEVYDVYLKAQLAGASGMKEVDHWMM